MSGPGDGEMNTVGCCIFENDGAGEEIMGDRGIGRENRRRLADGGGCRWRFTHQGRGNRVVL